MPKMFEAAIVQPVLHLLSDNLASTCSITVPSFRAKLIEIGVTSEKASSSARAVIFFIVDLSALL